MGNKPSRNAESPLEQPPPASVNLTPSPSFSSSSGNGVSTLLPRSESHERMSQFMNESKQGILSLSSEIVSESNCDINVYITAPPASGASQFCHQFEKLTGGRFRHADVSLPPPGPNKPSDHTRTRVGQLESIRKHILTDIAKHWPSIDNAQESGMASSPAVSDAVRLKYDCDLHEFALLQEIEEKGRLANGKPRFRVYEGNVLDACTVPIQTCKRVPILSDIASAGLEMLGNATWERWTRTAPVSSSLFVYIRYDDATYQAAYNAYRDRRDLSEEEKQLLMQLYEFHAEQKNTFDKIYYDGSPASLCSRHFVCVLNCSAASVTQPAHSHFMIQEILKVIRSLQGLPRVWGASSVDADRLVYLRTPAWVSGRIKAVPCNLFGGSYISPTTALRRNSLDESRSSSTLTSKKGVVRRGSLDLGPSRPIHT